MKLLHELLYILLIVNNFEEILKIFSKILQNIIKTSHLWYLYGFLKIWFKNFLRYSAFDSSRSTTRNSSSSFFFRLRWIFGGVHRISYSWNIYLFREFVLKKLVDSAMNSFKKFGGLTNTPSFVWKSKQIVRRVRNFRPSLPHIISYVVNGRPNVFHSWFFLNCCCI